jgi:hypothetical protein
LFTDADESLIVACSPFLLTGIENVIKRGDLAQRTLYVHLASVPDRERLTEQAFKARFKRAHADLLGALCAAAASGLRDERTLKLTSLPRLATFYHWASACEAALWCRGEFRRAFAANSKDATEDVIEGEQAASVFRRFITECGKWEGTATELLAELVAFVRRPVREAEAAHDKAVKAKDDAEKERTAAALREARDTARDILDDRWPKAPNALTGKLKRAAPALRNAGVLIVWPTKHGAAKIIKITTTIPKGKRQKSSSSSHTSSSSNKVKDLDRDADDHEDAIDPGWGDDPSPRWRSHRPGEDASRSSQSPPSHHNQLNTRDSYQRDLAQDGGDDLSPHNPDADFRFKAFCAALRRFAGDPIAAAAQTIAEFHGPFEADQLATYWELERVAGGNATRDKNWATDLVDAMRRLREASPKLAIYGVIVTVKDGGKIIRIERTKTTKE